MRKIILQLAISLDGFIEGPNGEYDWCYTDQDYGMTDFFKRVDSVFIGRKSYEMSLGMETADNSWMPKLKEYVFSNTITSVKEGAFLVKGNIKSEIEKIKEEPGKDIWLFGGASLTKALINERLVDEMSLAVHPILLGAGKLLFTDIQERIKLELTNSKSYSSGLVMLTYNVLK
jgi:dihydrofolate reductase